MNKKIFGNNLVIGCFTIKVDDLVIIDIKPDYTVGVFSNSLKEKIKEIEKMSNLEMVKDLEARNIKVSDKIIKLVEDNFFGKAPENFRDIFSRVAIIKGRAASVRSPEILIRDGFPEDFVLVPVKLTFSLAYLLTFILTKEFLNIHNMDRVFIMSEPLKKDNEHDDGLIIKWDPTYDNKICTALYENPYSGDKNAGYLFFY